MHQPVVKRIGGSFTLSIESPFTVPETGSTLPAPNAQSVSTNGAPTFSRHNRRHVRQCGTNSGHPSGASRHRNVPLTFRTAPAHVGTTMQCDQHISKATEDQSTRCIPSRHAGARQPRPHCILENATWGATQAPACESAGAAAPQPAKHARVAGKAAWLHRSQIPAPNAVTANTSTLAREPSHLARRQRAQLLR